MRATDSIFNYLLYNSTISVSFTGTSISSLVGSANNFSLKFSAFPSNQLGKVFGFSAKALNFSVASAFF